MAELYTPNGQPAQPPSPYQDINTPNGTIRLPIVGLIDSQVMFIIEAITDRLLAAIPGAQTLEAPEAPTTASHLKLVE